MTTIERTAYPRFKRNLTTKDLDEVYTPTPGERFLAARSTKGSVAEVGFLVLLNLLGISLMPRIRNWKDLKLFRSPAI